MILRSGSEMTKVYTIASGKGGTGKTVTVVNLGMSLALLSKRTIVLDADLGMANLGLVLGLEGSEITLHEVLAGKSDISQAVYELPTGLRVVPSGRSLEGFQTADLDRLQDVLSELIPDADYILIDAPSGISRDGATPLSIADAVLLVVNPELPSMTSAVKTMMFTEMLGGAIGGIILNRATAENPELTAGKIGDILGSGILEIIPEDPNIKWASAFMTPVVVKYPDSPAALAFRRLASKIAGMANVEQTFAAGEKREGHIDRLKRSLFKRN